MANELAALSNEIAAAVEVAGRNVVAVHARPRFSSSGVFWRPGVIVTAEHTIRREEEITVTLPDGATVPAVLAGTDPGTDLAVLKIEATTHAPVRTTTAPAPGTLALKANLRAGDVLLTRFETLNEALDSGRAPRRLPSAYARD